MTEEPTIRDKEATQAFAVLHVLLKYCGQRIPPELVDRIKDDMIKEMREGPCAWAFK